MQLEIGEKADVRIVRVKEAKLTYPNLSAFFAEVRQLVEGGTRKLLIDLSAVTYIDSASIGCLMDIYRLMQDRGGAVKLAGVQPRVETMISMTGVHKLIDLHREEGTALEAFGPAGARRRGRPMRKVRLSTGFQLALDGDILGLLEALYREVTLKRALQVSFEDMMREIQSLVEQMGEEERRRYLVESLFLNSVTYENEMLDAYMRRLTGRKKGGRGRSAGGSA
jgi:anti-sigma B factor antagonist